MGILLISIVLSFLNLYLFFKNKNKPIFDQELKEFRTYTESLITEFNRITTRNISMLDERIDELDHKIRLSQKIDSLLKNRFEELSQIEMLKVFELDSVYPETDSKPNKKNKKTVSKKKHLVYAQTDDSEYDITMEEPSLEECYAYIDEKNIEEEDLSLTKTNEEVSKDTTEKENQGLFEGYPIKTLKKYQQSKTEDRQNRLIQYIQQNKTKEELIELGFTSNEINLGFLIYTPNNDL